MIKNIFQGGQDKKVQEKKLLLPDDILVFDEFGTQYKHLWKWSVKTWRSKWRKRLRFAASVIELSGDIMEHCKFEPSIEVPLLNSSSRLTRLELSVLVLCILNFCWCCN